MNRLQIWIDWTHEACWASVSQTYFEYSCVYFCHHSVKDYAFALSPWDFLLDIFKRVILRKHLLPICFKHFQRERKRHSANKPLQPAGILADNVRSLAGVRNVAGKYEIFSVILFRGRFFRKLTKKSRNVNKLVGYNYRLTHSVSELSGFAWTSSLSKKEKFQYRTRLCVMRCWKFRVDCL